MANSKRGTTLDRPAKERGDLPAIAPNQDDPFWKKTAQEFTRIEDARKGIDGSAPVMRCSTFPGAVDRSLSLPITSGDL